eukprot:g4769.t1
MAGFTSCLRLQVRGMALASNPDHDVLVNGCFVFSSGANWHSACALMGSRVIPFVALRPRDGQLPSCVSPAAAFVFVSSFDARRFLLLAELLTRHPYFARAAAGVLICVFT